MKTKEDRLKMFRRTKTYKREESGDFPNHLFFGISLAVVLLFTGIGMASATTVYVATDGTGDYNCDGINDHVEINWALNNATSGDVVHVSAGTYFINDSIWINNTITFEGDGDSSILKFPNNCSNATHPEYERMICINANDTTIENIRFDGNTFNQTLPAGAEYLAIMSIKQNIWNTIIYQCDFVNALTDAIIPGEPPYAYNVTVDNCYFFNVDHGGVEGSFINSQVTNNTFYIDTFQGSSQGMNSAVRIYHGHGNVIKNNIVKKCGGWNSIAFGIEIHGVNNNNCSGTLIENNTFVNLFTRGISFDTLGGTPSTDLSTMRDIVIRNNVINGVQWSNPSYGQGIYIEGLWNNWTIENNVIYDVRVGIEEDDEKPTGGNITIKNNIITENREYGVSSGSGNFILKNNNIWGNTLDDYNGILTGIDSISVDPLFADPSKGDFHLKSEYGRWNGYEWCQDNETSQCIGAGELNGEKINMGAYGNTAEASLASTVTPTYPTITQHSPAGTAVPVETTLTATFSEAMNNISAEGAFSISPDVHGVFSWIGNKTIFTPDSNLDYERTYTVTLNTTAKDLEGNNMQSPFNWQFTTLALGMDLMGEWHFNEGTGVSVEDTSVNTNNGTLVNMDVIAWVTGKNGTALQFDGIEGYVDCGNNPVLDITDAITIETWLKPNVAGEGGPNAGPICKDEPGVDWSWQLRYNAPGGYMGFQFNGDPEGSTWVSVNQNLTPGDWYHVAGTFDGTTIRCYLNGVETDTNLLSAIKSGNATLFIGQDGWGNIFNGVVDELKIYNRALSAEEIQADYEAGFVELNTLSGTVTSPCGTIIPNATVTLTTRSGAEINTTQTDSTGHYAFANVSPGFYDITATKRSYWSNTNNVTVTADDPETADIVLCQKGDLNTNSEPADAGDLAMMADATAAGTSDVTYDLDGDGNPADEADLTLLKDVSVGVAVLE